MQESDCADRSAPCAKLKKTNIFGWGVTLVDVRV
jgi:hypothetical protein